MNIYELWFIGLDISNESKIILIEEYNNEENIYNNIDNIIKNNIITKRECIKLKQYNINEGYNLEEYLKKTQIEYVIYSRKEYPNKLRNITDPPYVLFYKGNIKLIYDTMVAIVGARKNTIYGEQVTKAIANEVSRTCYGIISGVAYGIDSIAHREILLKSGKTIGVLGCGIDIVYPKTNKGLYEEITRRGLLLSEFLPGTKPFAYNFPRRNRIISGLSDGVIVVEAAVKSGSIITASLALEQGKEVMVVPGSVFSDKSIGCHMLLRDGANCFIGIEDLYRFLNITKDFTKNKEKNDIKDEVLNLISDEPIHIDKIFDGVNVDRVVLFELLFEMQNRNEIICLPGNYYAKIS